MSFDKRGFLKLFFLLALALNFSLAAPAQKTKVKPQKKETPGLAVAESAEAILETGKLNSKLMARQMPYNVYLPDAYKWSTSSAVRYPVIYLLHGLGGHFDNWAAKTDLKRYAVRTNAIIVMAEGENGWYTDNASAPNDRYESYIAEELIPEIDKKYRTQADRAHRFIAGLSMGGYGSIKFGLKRPELFALVGSFSGALGAADWTEREIGTKGAIAESILKVYGAAGSQTRKENDVFQMIRDLTDEKVKTLPYFYLGCGTEDFLIQNNLDFVKLLREKKVPHEFRELPGKHDWVFWNSQVEEFLRLCERFLKNQAAAATTAQVQNDSSFCTLAEQKITTTITLDEVRALPPGTTIFNAAPGLVAKP
jgi:S-formylglutathione hydrolase FrmB